MLQLKQLFVLILFDSSKIIVLLYLFDLTAGGLPTSLFSGPGFQNEAQNNSSYEQSINSSHFNQDAMQDRFLDDNMEMVFKGGNRQYSMGQRGPNRDMGLDQGRRRVLPEDQFGMHHEHFGPEQEGWQHDDVFVNNRQNDGYGRGDQYFNNDYRDRELSKGPSSILRFPIEGIVLNVIVII